MNKQNTVSRRTALAGMAATGVSLWSASSLARQVYKEAHELKPGEFSWHPERAMAGPVSIIVSLPDQLARIMHGHELSAAPSAVFV